MKRKTAVLLLSLFFVSSVVAISTVNNGEQVTLIGDYEPNSVIQTPDQHFDQAADSADIAESNLVAGIVENSNYATDSPVVLVETKEDKHRLKVQEKQIKRGKQKQLTADLNKQVNQALKQQIASDGKPLKATNNNDVVIVKAASNELRLPPSKSTELASLTNELQLNERRKGLNLGAPIPPGTFGGGNGNGGPGAGVSSQTASGN